jgi:predicted ester cyclase
MTLEQTKSIIRRIYAEIWSRGNVGSLPELFSAGLVFADRDDASLRGYAGVKTLVQRWHAGFPDMQEDILDLVAEGDRAICRFRLTGTHQGPFLGIAATGRRIDVEGVDLYRLGGGKIVAWEYLEDTLGLLRQLGRLPV